MPKPVKKFNQPKNLRGQFSTVVDLDTLRAASKGGELPEEIPVLPKGEYMTLPYGNLVLDDTVFEQMIGNFKANIRRAVPVDFDHSWESTKAAGWIKELVNKADGLWAKVDWNKLGTEAIVDKIYRMISAEWSFDYVDPQKSTHHGAVLVAATLTNRPLMQSMPTITASEAGKESDLTNTKGIMILLNEDSNTTTQTMNIAEILAKKPEDRTEEEVKFLTDSAADLTDEQKAQLETEKTEAAKGEGEEGEQDKGEAGEGEESEDADESEDDDAEEGDEDKTEEVKASEIKRLRELEANTKAAEALKAATDFATPFMASEKGGHVAPKAKDQLIKLAQSLNKDQLNLLTSVLNATQTMKIAGAKGEDETEGLTATEQYNNLINKLMSEGKTPSEANKIVRKEHKDIYAAYLAENK